MNSHDIGTKLSNREALLTFDHIKAPKATHSLFRYPAKFHPPIAHHLIRSYSERGQVLLDPFCGSGTLCVAASLEERHSLGCDIDPVAAFVARTKTHRYQPSRLSDSWAKLSRELAVLRATAEEYTKRVHYDLTDCEFGEIQESESLWIPEIPNVFHWFRKYVLVDLARISRAISNSNMPQTHKRFFRLMFASILRRASNADPVPVSGLEVTSHMRKLEEAGRYINPYALFFAAAEKGIVRARDYWSNTTGRVRARIIEADARRLPRTIRNSADVVITSPPYHNAVDYYRRHQLEMYWLGLTPDHDSRLELLPKYIGRPRVRKDSALLLRATELGSLASMWEAKIREVSSVQADAFVHYMVSMADAFSSIADALKPDGDLVVVVGDNRWHGENLPTSRLLATLLSDNYVLREAKWYPLKNRYMSYARRNGADISRENVLVYRKQS